MRIRIYPLKILIEYYSCHTLPPLSMYIPELEQKQKEQNNVDPLCYLKT